MSKFVKYILTFLISMVPFVELRGAIPFGVGFGLNEINCFIIAIIGNMLPVPFIYLFSRKILQWGKDKKYIGKFFSWCLIRGENAGKKLQKLSSKGLYIGLLLFVGIPVPGTGAWTGTLASSLLKLDFKKTIISVILGVLLAGVIMMMISFGIFNIIF